MTPALAIGMLARALARDGETVTLTTVDRPGRPAAAASVLARVTGYRPEDLVDDVRQRDRKVVLAAADLVAAGFPVPPLENDKVTVRGAVLNVEAVDGETRSVGGVTIGFEIQARGGG